MLEFIFFSHHTQIELHPDERKPEPKKVAASPQRNKFVPLFSPEGKDRTVVQIPGKVLNYHIYTEKNSSI